MVEKHQLKRGDPICYGCAGLYGAAWPEDHIATSWSDVCAQCGTFSAVCSVSDWNWPGNQEKEALPEYREF